MRFIKLVIFLFAFLFFFTGVASAQDSATILFEANSPFKSGSQAKVTVYLDSNTQVNAAQLSISYPQSNFSLVSIDSTKSAFKIKAEESATPGVAKIALGNIQPLVGRNLFTVLTFNILSSKASTTQLGYTSDSLVMSTKGVNILAGSTVVAQKPSNNPPGQNVTPKPTKAPTKGFVVVFSQAVKEFFNGLFGKK